MARNVAVAWHLKGKVGDGVTAEMVHAAAADFFARAEKWCSRNRMVLGEKVVDEYLEWTSRQNGVAHDVRKLTMGLDSALYKHKCQVVLTDDGTLPPEMTGIADIVLSIKKPLPKGWKPPETRSRYEDALMREEREKRKRRPTKAAFDETVLKSPPTVYGYARRENYIVAHERRAEWIATLFKGYISGATPEGLALKMLRLAPDRKWTARMVKAVIRTRVYKGESGYPPIVTESEFDEANRLLTASFANVSPRFNTSVFLCK